MKYICINTWRDLEDGHLYKEGDPYPREGREVSETRITALSGTQNKAGFALIKAVEGKGDQMPIQDAETPKKGVRSRKKTI